MASGINFWSATLVCPIDKSPDRSPAHRLVDEVVREDFSILDERLRFVIRQLVAGAKDGDPRDTVHRVHEEGSRFSIPCRYSLAGALIEAMKMASTYHILLLT